MSSEANRPLEGKWLAKPLRSRSFAIQGLGFTGLYLVYFLVRRLAKLNGVPHPTELGIAAAMIAGIGWKIWPLAESRRKSRCRPEDKHLADDNFGEQFPVEIAVFARQRPLGSDRGVVWFSDGLMGFSGSSFSFVLAAHDMVPQWIGVKRDPSYPANSIVLKNSPVPGHLVVTPLGANNDKYRERLYRFSKASESPKGERIWPPLTPFDPENTLGARIE